MGLTGAPGQEGGSPPIDVPGDPTNEWKWNPDHNNKRGGSWGPKRPIPGQSQPGASWDPEGHWDVDNGQGERQRYDEDGNPISPDEAHNNRKKCDLSQYSSGWESYPNTQRYPRYNNNYWQYLLPFLIPLLTPWPDPY